MKSEMKTLLLAALILGGLAAAWHFGLLDPLFAWFQDMFGNVVPG